MTNSRTFYRISKKGIRDNVNTGTAKCASALLSSKASIKKKKALHLLYQQLTVIPHSTYDDTLQASESLNFNSTLTILIAQENFSAQPNHLFNALLSKQ